MPTTRRRILGSLAAGVLVAALGGATTPARADDSPWQRVALPTLATRSALDAVTARAGDDVWAAGYEGAASANVAAGRPLLLHWTGTRWRRTPVAGAPWTGNVVSVAAARRGLAWATALDSDGRYRLLRWNGAVWSDASFPGQADGVGAYKVFAGPGGEAWLLTTNPAGLLRSAGGAWQAVPNPPSAPSIAGIRVQGPGDVWVAGSIGTFQCYAAHWDGTAWHELPTYGVPFYAGFIDASSTGDDDVWAIGNARGAGTVAPIVPVLTHWDGTAWTRTPLTWIPAPSGINVGAVRSYAPDDRRQPGWVGITDTYGTPPNAATYARYENGQWTEVYGPADTWNSYPRMFVTHAPGTSTYWAAGSATDADGNAVPRVERTG